MNIIYAYLKDNGYAVCFEPGWIENFIGPDDPMFADIKKHIASHPEALQPDRAPPVPTPEQLKEREISEKLSYLRDTDWYVIRSADSGMPVPDDIKAARAQARARIDELKA